MKKRIPIDTETSSSILFLSDYTCCICRDRTRSVQIHHIDENPANNDVENLCLLCLICHDETQIRGGFGRKLNAQAVRKYRSDWLARVIQRREQADQLAAMTMAGVVPKEAELAPVNAQNQLTADEDIWIKIPADEALVQYVLGLPEILATAYRSVETKLGGTTQDMVEATYYMVDVVVQILIHLSDWFPEKHFGGMPAAEYFSQIVSNRAIWQHALAEPSGEGTGGTMARITTASGLLDEVQNLVKQMVVTLLWGRENFRLKAWERAWSAAGLPKA